MVLRGLSFRLCGDRAQRMQRGGGVSQGVALLRDWRGVYIQSMETKWTYSV